MSGNWPAGRGAAVSHLLFENRSLVDFQIVNERKRELRAAETGFYLHKEFRVAEISFYLHKEFPRGRDRIFSTQRIFYKKNHEKLMVCFKTFSALRALIC